ncbi:hypothetical protein C8J57DRAFT_1537512 [Mycena rebaudengoi]|nr:hypothetical protein C8J57DRAFT_1538080 [Mycena rebaudengoi]KAJ7218344.1 hypothetical protein C8J57DRAFT_1537512 [Mycena rebaudengoi]
MVCVEFGAQMMPADFINHLEHHPDFLALLEFRADFFPPQSPNDCFRTTHRIERTCAGCGSATVEGDFRARIIGQLTEPIQSLNDHHTFTLQAPDWTAQGWEISVFHDLWARQLGVLNVTEKDIEIRAWLQKLSLHIESWSSKARIKGYWLHLHGSIKRAPSFIIGKAGPLCWNVHSTVRLWTVNIYCIPLFTCHNWKWVALFCFQPV